MLLEPCRHYKALQEISWAEVQFKEAPRTFDGQAGMHSATYAQKLCNMSTLMVCKIH